MSEPRIAIIAPYLSTPSTRDPKARVGGVERYVTELAKALVAIGKDVTLITPSMESGGTGIGEVPILRIKRVAIIQGSPIFNPAALLRAIRGFDLVHAQGTYPLISELNPLLARIRGIPSVVTYHFEPTPTAPLGKIAGRIYESTMARMVRWNDRIILSTKSYRENTRLLRNVSDEKTRYIPMGVDTKFFAPDPGSTREKRFLFVGRLVPYKDIPLLLKAMAIVNRTLQSHELNIVGTGELEDTLKKEAAGSGANVRFLGRVDDAELLKLYQTSAATVLPSHDHQEAFGMTLVESMSCGTPVVAARIPGVMDVASIGGKVVEAGSAVALAEAMIDATRTDLTPTQKQSLHSRIDEMFSWKSIATRTSAVYEELL